MGLVDIIFGPCLDNSAVDSPQNRRQGQPPQQPRHPSPDAHSHASSERRLVVRNDGDGRRTQSHHDYPPTIRENEEQRRGAEDPGSNGNTHQRRKHGNGAQNGSLVKRKSRHKQGDLSSDMSSLSASLGGKGRGRRDDASVVTASLFETKGYMSEDQDEADEHRRTSTGQGPSLQQHVGHGSGKRGQHPHRSDRSDTSDATELEWWLEKKGRRRADEDAATHWDAVTTVSKASANPYRVLGISQNASPREAYGRYKRRMRETELSGGSDRAFADVGNAYRRIRADLQRQEARKARDGTEPRGGGRRTKRHGRPTDEGEASDAKSRQRIDARLKDHSELVRGLFAKDNAKTGRRTGMSANSSVSTKGEVTTLQKSVRSQAQALSELNIVPVEGGASNINEQNKTIHNSCFYLSLAASYLSGAGAFDADPTAPYYLRARGAAGDGATVRMEVAALPRKEKRVTMHLALQLKRAIEAAVLLVHPDWARTGAVGESVQAFSDFLVYALDSDSVLGHWAIAVFDEASGFVDVYRGRRYGKAYPPARAKGRRGGRGAKDAGTEAPRPRYRDCDAATRRATTLTLRYIPGHYQPLLPELTKLRHEGPPEGAGRPALEDILSALEKWNVLHVVTDGRA